MVERRIRPALRKGAVVVTHRYMDSPIANLGAEGDFEPGELETLADWATQRLRPDVTVLLDRRDGHPRHAAELTGDHHWRVQRILAEMAAADPARYVVVDADAAPDEVAHRVRVALEPVLAARRITLPTTMGLG
jgi:dTMP kinase